MVRNLRFKLQNPGKYEKNMPQYNISNEFGNTKKKPTDFTDEKKHILTFRSSPRQTQIIISYLEERR